METSTTSEGLQETTNEPIASEELLLDQPLPTAPEESKEKSKKLFVVVSGKSREES